MPLPATGMPGRAAGTCTVSDQIGCIPAAKRRRPIFGPLLSANRVTADVRAQGSINDLYCSCKNILRNRAAPRRLLHPDKGILLPKQIMVYLPFRYNRNISFYRSTLSIPAKTAVHIVNGTKLKFARLRADVEGLIKALVIHL